MGLGPLCCEHCGVLAEWYEMGDGPGGLWGCPICERKDLSEHTGIGADLNKYKENLKFLKFVKGIDDGTPTNT